MKSHTYEFALSELLRLVLGPLATVAAFALLMHAGARWGFLPSPRPTLDADRTILIHQAETSRKVNPAKILLLGDSSCLMGVSAQLLSEKMGQPTLNLATLSYLDAGANSRLLREFVTANPGQLRAVVLLMHPEALRRVGSEDYQAAVLTNYLGRTDHHRLETTAGKFSCWLGLDIFKGRILARTIPAPLAGAFGRMHGFNSELENFMTANQGSLWELDSAPLDGSAEYRLSPSLQAAAGKFKAAMPPGAKLLVGLTPVPEGLAGANYPEAHLAILQQWGAWLGADAILDDLPPTLPDKNFARTTHLKPEAVAEYTIAVARALEGRLK